jgi:hypothetical protein
MANYHYVDNTGSDTRMFHDVFMAAYTNGFIDEDFADIFSIDFIDNANDDGSRRMIVDFA